MTVVMIKPTNSCNLACTYCYNSDVFLSAPKDLMSYATLVNSLEKITRYENRLGRTVIFEWIGGEPLLAGINFYRDVVEITNKLRKEGYNLEHVMQTNGVLLNDVYVDFLVDNGFKLGFSLDGTKAVHNKTRINHSGKGTFDSVMKGILKYKEKTGRAGVVCVVTRQNLEYVEELYDFCKEYGIGLQLNSLTPKGDALRNLETLAVSPQDYAEAVLKVFRKWLNDSNESLGSESVLESVVLNILAGKEDTFGNCVTKQHSCQDPSIDNLISVNPKGDVYPCTAFDGIPRFRLGNINEVKGYEEIAESPERMYLKERNLRVQKATEKTDIGCLHAAYDHSGDIDVVDPMANARKSIREGITAAIEPILMEAKING